MGLNLNINDFCLYYAKNADFKEIKKYHKMFILKFELAKFNKHRTQGKTTKHRKSKKEQHLSLLRNAVLRCNKIYYYKKQLSLGKLEYDLGDLKLKKPLYDFLIGG